MTNLSSRINEVTARVFNASNAAPVYTQDARGRMVRVFSKDAPLTAEVVRYFYLYERAFDVEEVLEAIGANGLRYQVEAGFLAECPVVKNRYWVTAKAAKNYSLPTPRAMVGAGKPAFYPTPFGK